MASIGGNKKGEKMEADLKVNETHPRTTVKTITYRIVHMLWVFILAMMFGGTAIQSGTLVLAATIVGTVGYYAYDRVWVLIPWGHKSDGSDKHARSLIKTLGYRIVMIIAATIVAMIIMDFSLLRAASLAASDFVSAMFLYYIIERTFSFISWGRKIEVAVNN